MDVGRAAAGLVLSARGCALIGEQDLVWAYNRVLECIGAPGPAASFPPAGEHPCALEDCLDALVEAGVAGGMVEDSLGGRDRLAMRIMGVLTPRPSEVSAIFWALYEERGPEAATDYLYRLSCDAGYVRLSAIAKNLSWDAETPWGVLEITINRSKPEKDPRDIAAAAAAPAGGAYPACQLCVENEGYAGRGAGHAGGAHPARQNLRIVPIELLDERWGLQYSPYAYYREHCIAMSVEHRPMHIDRAAFSRLLDFTDLFPHYFIGSNADLPIVGGSILSHDHFQGGRHEFPMMRAKRSQSFPISAFPQVEASVIEWPLSVIRLEDADRAMLLDAACHVLEVWRGWNDGEAGIVAFTGEIPHNTITPICRKLEGRYTMDLALRCNIASEEHPLGVFHPHEDRWHVKKENIGLIEVMGLAILPPRLEAELAAGRITRDEIGDVFAGVLEDAGVFKWDEKGRTAQQRFIDALA
ncbi:UDP-glucose--hexose-1-phosphate uridylyltransferase [Coriobacteriales bacterium OH1046]|nr:UDP-glucose--hexose-1-phosphate uridylyltransferase [Coriobacteriales bacterium OH1046]